MTSERPLLRVENATKNFGSLRALDGVNLELDASEVLCLIGPSGSGKSTLLRSIPQLDRIDSGYIWLEDELIGYEIRDRRPYELKPRELAKQRRQFGMVFQGFNLFPHMTVLENLTEAPIRIAGASKSDAEEEARALLASVGLAEKANEYPAMLSGGQQQRAAIARAVAMHPKVMLFDEPTSALDPELVGEVLEVMKGLAEGGMTMIIVTHELQFAREVGDRVVFMVDGKVVESGAAHEVFANPRHERTQQFLSKMSPNG